MEIIIDIPEETFRIIEQHNVYPYDVDVICNAILSGTPLPKGHGDLIDRKDLIENGISKGFCNWYDEIKMADTIIEGSDSE